LADEIPPPNNGAVNPTVRYERSDVNARWVLIVLVGMLAIGVVIELAISGFFHGYRDYQDRTKQSQYPLSPSPSRTALPREPRLEQIDRLSGNDAAIDRDRDSRDREILDSYGPSSRDGFVHIPIGRAMQLLSEKKTLKSRPEPPADERKRSEGLIDAGEPNSGRLFKGESK
jgi:hypothetical protein